MKTLADLKRKLVKGTAITLTKFSYQGKAAPHKYLLLRREIEIAQSNSFACVYTDPNGNKSESSWQDWPKSSELTIIDDNTFKIDKGWVSLTYRIGD